MPLVSVLGRKLDDIHTVYHMHTLVYSLLGLSLSIEVMQTSRYSAMDVVAHEVLRT